MTAADPAGRPRRREDLRALVDRRSLAGIVLRRPANFAWYTGGADNRVDYSSPLGAADIVVTRDGEYVLTSTIEESRMRDEQTPDIEIAAYPWYEDAGPALRRLCSGQIGADVPLPGETDISGEIDEMRRVLDETALRQYREVGADARAAMDETIVAMERGMTEWEAAALLRAACTRRGMHSPVVLIAADDRIARYRHPLPTFTTIERRAMLVVCAERHGLYANLTRFADLEEPDEQIRARMALCEEILRRLREEATRPGRTLAQVLEDGMRYYAEAGYPDEWRKHHQGGPTGYLSRELVATPTSTYRVQVNQAFAWNPSITGAKAEETFLLVESGTEVVA